MKDKNIVVSGGRGALGEAVVAAFANHGATVHVPSREVRFDDEAAVVSYYAKLPPLWASIHVVGGFDMSPIADTSLAAFEQQWRINTVTCFLACREAVKALRKAGGGRIVNVASRAALTASPGMTAYATAKAAVAAFTQSLAAEVLGDNILVNAVLPGTIDTASNRAAMPKADHGTWVTPASIAKTIAFLASPDNTTTSGALVPAYGRS